MDKKNEIVLKKIKAEAQVIADLIQGFNCDSFVQDERTKRAVCMTLINIGELVKLLSNEIKKAHASIPWRAIAGLRDVTAHGYMTLRMEDIWETVSVDVVKLKMEINSILQS